MVNSGAGDGNRTNPNESHNGVTTHFLVQLESNHLLAQSRLGVELLIIEFGATPLELPFEVYVRVLEQDTGSANQGGAYPQDNGEEEPITL